MSDIFSMLDGHGFEIGTARVHEAKATVSVSMVERVARAIMQVKARRPASSEESYILASDPDFDDLPASGDEGTKDDEITQEAVLRIARAAIEAMREPSLDMVDSACFAWIKLYPAFEGQKQRPTAGELVTATFNAMIDAALKKK